MTTKEIAEKIDRDLVPGHGKKCSFYGSLDAAGAIALIDKKRPQISTTMTLRTTEQQRADAIECESRNGGDGCFGCKLRNTFRCLAKNKGALDVCLDLRDALAEIERLKTAMARAELEKPKSEKLEARVLDLTLESKANQEAVKK